MTAAKAKTIFDEAVKCGVERDYARSASLLTEILAEGDGPADAYLYLGRARHALGEHPQAIQAFQAYADSGGDMAAALFFSGRSFLAMGLAGRAVSVFRRCLELSPGSAQCLGLLGIALLKEGRSAKASLVLQRAVEAAPSDARIYRAYLNALFIQATRKLSADEVDAAEKMLAFVIENGHEGLPPRIHRARALFRLGRWEEALRAYDDVISRGGRDPAILLRKALILGALGRAEEAQTLWDGLRGIIRDLPPTIPGVKAYPALAAIAELERGDWKEAAASAISGLKSDPRDPLLHAVAAEAFMETGAFVKAANHFRRSLEADPSNRAAREALVACLWNSSDLEGLKKELRALKRAESASEEGSAAVLERYGLLLEAREKKADPDLLLRLLKAIEKNGPDKELMALLASAALSLGRHALALPWYERLSEEEPSSIRNRRGLISCLAEVGPAEKLDEAYLSFIADFPDEAALRREYADKLRAVERWEEAASHYEAIIPFERDKRSLLEIVAFCLRNAGLYRDAAVIYRDLALKDQKKKAYAKGLIYCLYKMKRSGIALTLAESAMRQFKDEGDMVFLRAWLLAKTGKAEKALDALRAASDAMPKNPEPWRMMADIHASLGSPESEARCRRQAEALHRASAPGPRKKK